MALPDTIKLTTGTSRTTGLAAASLANNALVVGSEIANSTNLDELATLELTYAFGTNPTANATLEVYAIYAVDGMNYEDGATNVTPFAPAFIGAVSVTADTNTHRVTFRSVQLEPHKLKFLVRNNATGQTATVTLLAYTYNRSLVD